MHYLFKAVEAFNPVLFILQFSDEPPMIVVFAAPTNLFAVKSILPVIKYVTFANRVMTALSGLGKSVICMY
jgi:hypothetical protein